MVKQTKKTAKAANAEDNLTEQQKAWWNEIKERAIELYGLPNQIVGSYASPINMDPDSLYLSIKAPAAVPAIEEALAKLCDTDRANKLQYPKYTMSMAERYMVVKPNKGKIVKDAATGKMVFVASK